MSKENRVSDERLAEMLAGLDSATPGPWRTQDVVLVGDDVGSAYIVGDGLVAGAHAWPTEIDHGDFERVESNAAHIANCDPDTIRSILTELKEWRDNVEAMLSSGDQDVIRCHEGGGPENSVGSLVLTVMRTRNARDMSLAEIESLGNAGNSLQADLDHVSAAIGSVRWMDPPDGGSVPLGEQVNRMRVDLEAAERKNEELLDFVHRWTWVKEGNGTSDQERLDVIKHYPPIAGLVQP